ncbi:MAG: hypothetical protein ABR948_29075, partial [Bradyrhizobium sp.]
RAGTTLKHGNRIGDYPGIDNLFDRDSLTALRCWIQCTRIMRLHGNLRKVLDCRALRLHEPPRGKGKNGRAENASGFVFELGNWRSRDGPFGRRICAKRYPHIDDTGRNVLPQSPYGRSSARVGVIAVRRLDSGNADIRSGRLPCDHLGALLVGINGLQLRRLNSSIMQRCPSGPAAESLDTSVWKCPKDALANTKHANISHDALLKFSFPGDGGISRCRVNKRKESVTSGAALIWINDGVKSVL